MGATQEEIRLPHQIEGQISLTQYQEMALGTAVYAKDIALTYAVLGVSAEAGELANKYKKVLRDDGSVLTDEKRTQLQDELGDILWYCAILAKELGTDLNTVGVKNLNKLYARKVAGTLKGSGDNR